MRFGLGVMLDNAGFPGDMVIDLMFFGVCFAC